MSPPPAEALGVADDHARWLTAKLTPQPLRAFERAVRLGDSAAAALPRTYVHSTEGPLVPSFAPFADRFRTDPAWPGHEVVTGHDAMQTEPEALAALLLGSIENAENELPAAIAPGGPSGKSVVNPRRLRQPA